MRQPPSPIKRLEEASGIAKRLLCEVIGTFALVFCGTGAIVIDTATSGAVGHLGVALSFGLTILAMVVSFGDLSGSHINPAVTLAFWATGRFPRNEVVWYIAAQLSGAFIATTLLRLLFPADVHLGSTVPAGSDAQAFVLETILTFLLMTVVLHVSTDSREKGLLAGMAIGATVLVEAAAAGPVTGASMNPARSIAPAVVSGNLTHLWIYIAGPSAGALLAVIPWRVVRGGSAGADAEANR